MPAIPKINRPLLDGFLWFAQRYLRKHFHVFAANCDNLLGFEPSEQDALVVYANHSSWWDPLAALVLAKHSFPKHRVYAPIDAVALEKYKMFANMGFYGVEQSTQRGAVDFLRTSLAILEQDNASIWLTPEGQFVDMRDQSVELSGGLAHLATKLAMRARDSRAKARRVWFIAVGVEYTFWEERKPEALCWFAKPVCVTSEESTSSLSADAHEAKSAWAKLLSDRLRAAQADLAAASIARDAGRFEILISSRSGTFFVYDWWRRVVAKLRGKTLDIDHSDRLR
jgi:hypothetical protein